MVRRAALLGCAVAAVVGLGARGALAAGTDTLGVTTVGSLSASAVASYLDASGPYTLAAAATVTTLTGYVSGGPVAFPLRAVVYADSGGEPGAFVAVSSEVTIAPSQAAGWVDFPLPAGVTVAAGRYWLGYWFGGSGATFAYAAVSGGERYVPAAYSSSGSPPASYGSAATSDSSYSLYATVGSGAGGGSPPASTGLPAISGTAQQGQTLAASTGSWSNAPTSMRTSGSAATRRAGLHADPRRDRIELPAAVRRRRRDGPRRGDRDERERSSRPRRPRRPRS